jgi:hypothetical protein
MKYAIIKNGRVSNIALADFPIETNWVSAEDANIGDLYQDGQFLPAPPDTEAEAASARARRNAELAASDWTQLADAPVDNLAWAIYRQALRDISEQPGFPSTIVWPAAPDGKPPNG